MTGRQVYLAHLFKKCFMIFFWDRAKNVFSKISERIDSELELIAIGKYLKKYIMIRNPCYY